MANSVDSDETARTEPSHLDLHCLHSYSFWSAGLKRLIALGIRTPYLLIPLVLQFEKKYDTDAPAQGHPHPQTDILQKIKLKLAPHQ